MRFSSGTLTLLCTASLRATLAATVDWKTLKNDATGNGIPDFSYCGYHQSNISLPSSHRTAAKTLSPGSGDQSTTIQSALDDVSKAGGGVVALEAGSYVLQMGLVIPNGTTLRGASPSETTLLPASGSLTAVTLGQGASNPEPSTAVDITDTYVVVGSTTVTVKSASGLKVGQSVWIQRRVTTEWVRANGNGGLGTGEGTWLTPNDFVYQPRVITAISGNKVTLNIGLTDQLDAKYMSPQLVLYTPPASDSEMGLESLSITLKPSCSGAQVGFSTCKGQAVEFAPWTFDSYARELAITGFGNGISVEGNASRITITSVSIHRDTASDTSAGSWADISISGYQTLVNNSATKVSVSGAKSFPVLTQGLTPGPNAVVGHYVQEYDSSIQPHAHWAHGFLVDNSTAFVSFINRGTDGSGHGWAINSGIAWNVAGNYSIESPPLGANWGIGDHGGEKMDGQNQIASNGTFVDEGQMITPAGLFVAQLADRGLSW